MDNKEKQKTVDRTEVKKAYKQTRQPMGVYAVSNSHDEKVFVGFAADLPARINRHKAELRFKSHRNRELQKMWNSYGESAFKFEILEMLDHEEKIQVSPEEELCVLAQLWVQKLENKGHLIVSLNY